MSLFNQPTLLSRLLATAALTAVLFAPVAAQAQKRVTVMMFGSTWERVFKPLAPAFQKETGLEIVPVIENTSIEGLAKIQAMRARPEVDV
jgi:putative spermidine/putrescine transport system substrate-binding protein